MLQPLASRSRMSDTQMRWPLMQGFPKQTFGSMEIRANNSSRVMGSLSSFDANGQAAFSSIAQNGWPVKLQAENQAPVFFRPPILFSVPFNSLA